MFHTDTEYEEGRRRLNDEAMSLNVLERKLKQMRFTEGEIQRALQARLTYQKRLAEDVQTYERLRDGDVSAVPDRHGLGDTLIALRIALGMSQKDLAHALGLPEMQIMRGERNRYQDLSVRAARRILETLRAMEQQATSLKKLTAMQGRLRSARYVTDRMTLQ